MPAHRHTWTHEADMLRVLDDIEHNLFLPQRLLRDGAADAGELHVQYGIVKDCSVLTCGCCVSESLFRELCNAASNEQVACPICQRENIQLLSAIKPLRDLARQIDFLRSTATQAQTENEEFPSVLRAAPSSLSSLSLSPSKSSSTAGFETDNKTLSNPTTKEKSSLLELFHIVASKIHYSKTEIKSSHSLANTGTPPEQEEHSARENYAGSVPEPIYDDHTNWKVLDNASNTRTVPIDNNSLLVSADVTIPSTANYQANSTHDLDEEKEYFFANCFPMYRKKFQFNTHPKFLGTKSKLFINQSISPDCTKFALITEHKWEVYSINSKDNSPRLVSCGKSSGEYGTDFNQLTDPSPTLTTTISQASKKKKKNWNQRFCKLSNDFLIISGSQSIFNVHDMNQNGKPIFTYVSTFPIRCIDIDPRSQIIAYGITGKDRHTGAEQALVVIQQITRNKVTSEPEFPPPITITLPYRDPINTIQLSQDAKYLTCSTALESRFLIISLQKINEPRLIMKSVRSIDTSLESEGITDTKLFPGNPNLMCVTSTAFNSSPLVINTKITQINGVRTVAQPSMLIRVDEIGCKIHKCEISPRNDAIAFLDRNGSVYIMCAPTMMDNNEKRRTILVETVANAYRAYESATLRFNPEGNKLYILDRKGTFFVEDFAYGLPQSREITKCKQIFHK
ncbi:ptr3p [Saccharomyces arboricola H-6]|uniref:Ptr3p n=1 Tax=Saccharomyces arboricola (strain H-6 / AS 2.3317 / CBS 10644) TaxID=1160507 RepID=J8Q5H6_SACAR|nr:ptr3p [Saccharomyces arboricola H-6]